MDLSNPVGQLLCEVEARVSGIASAVRNGSEADFAVITETGRFRRRQEADASKV